MRIYNESQRMASAQAAWDYAAPPCYDREEALEIDCSAFADAVISGEAFSDELSEFCSSTTVITDFLEDDTDHEILQLIIKADQFDLVPKHIMKYLAIPAPVLNDEITPNAFMAWAEEGSLVAQFNDQDPYHQILNIVLESNLNPHLTPFTERVINVIREYAYDHKEQSLLEPEDDY